MALKAYRKRLHQLASEFCEQQGNTKIKRKSDVRKALVKTFGSEMYLQGIAHGLALAETLSPKELKAILKTMP